MNHIRKSAKNRLVKANEIGIETMPKQADLTIPEDGHPAVDQAQPVVSGGPGSGPKASMKKKVKKIQKQKYGADSKEFLKNAKNNLKPKYKDEASGELDKIDSKEPLDLDAEKKFGPKNIPTGDPKRTDTPDGMSKVAVPHSNDQDRGTPINNVGAAVRARLKKQEKAATTTLEGLIFKAFIYAHTDWFKALDKELAPLHIENAKLKNGNSIEGTTKLNIQQIQKIASGMDSNEHVLELWEKHKGQAYFNPDDWNKGRNKTGMEIHLKQKRDGIQVSVNLDWLILIEFFLA